MANRLVIHLHIDQPIPDGEDGKRIINDYIDELAKTDGSLTWSEVDWDLFPLATDGEASDA
jgi:hypothetical protein